MKHIGGNITARIQTKTDAKNAIHENVPVWTDTLSVVGWLDLSSGDSNHNVFNAKVQESTHIFLCDYRPLPNIISENARMVIDGLVYEILLIDNPMGMNQHYEIYLRFVGGSNER